MGNRISQWLNNITDKEKRIYSKFIKDPEKISPLVFDEGKVIYCSLLILRIREIIKDHGMEAIEIVNKLLWGLPKDKKIDQFPTKGNWKFYKA